MSDANTSLPAFRSCCVSRKHLPKPKSSIHVETELDRYLHSFRETQLTNIAAEAAQLRDTETNIEKALMKLEHFLSILSSLAAEVCLACCTVQFSSIQLHTLLNQRSQWL